MDLLLIRHARPARHDAEPGRAADPALTEEGHEQAQRLADWLAHERIDTIASSPALRARQTATPVAQRLRLEPEIIDGLAEFDSTASSYVPVEELKELGDERWEALERGQPYSTDIDPHEFRERVVEAVEGLVAANPGRVVAAFCHAGVVNAYVGHLLDVTTPLWFAPDYTSISRVAASRGGRRSVVTLNESGHLVARRDGLTGAGGAD